MYVDPIFQAGMPDPYYRQLNYGTNGVLPEAAGWNVNSAYLTPTFMAGYRPAYSGPQNMQMPYMGFWRGVNTAAPTPWQPDTPYYMDSRAYREGGMSSAGNKAMDIAMTGAQLASGIMVSSVIGNWVGRNANLTSATMGQMFRGENALGRLGAGLGRGFGALGGSLTAGAGTVLGQVSPWGGARIAQGAAALGQGIMRAGAVVGGFAGGMLLPFAAGVGVAEMVDRMALRPYLAGRQSADVLRSQFEGTAMGLGTSHSPLGISNANAARIGSAVSSAFGGRIDFNDMAAPQFLQFGMQEGLYRNIGKVNASTITARTKELAEQVKMVMDVFNEPSMQDAIKELGRMMNAGGVSGTAGVASMLSKYKLASAATGISSRELAGTIGIQGQMMYGQAGLVPALGQAVGLTAMRGIDAAFRSGLVGADVMAMLGGRQGMVQGTQQGLLGLSQTTYNKIMAYNQYALGGAGGNITSNLATMGADLARDPLGALGRFQMNANKAVSAQMKNDPYAAIQQTLHVLNTMPSKDVMDSQGRYRSEVVYSLLLQQGLDPQSAESLLRSIQGAPEAHKRLVEASRGVAISNREKFLEQNGLLYYNSAIGQAYYGARSGFAGVAQYMGEAWGGLSENFGGMMDAASGALMGISGAATASGLYDVNAAGSYEDFMTKKSKSRAAGAGRKISMGGKGRVNWGAFGVGAAGYAAGALLSGTGIGAVIGLPLMAASTATIAAGGLGFDPAAAQRLEGLYKAADSDGKLMTILNKANDGERLSTSEQAYLAKAAGTTTEDDLQELISNLGYATVEGGGAGKEFNLTEYEEAQKNFSNLLKEELGKAPDLTDSTAPGPMTWGIATKGTKDKARGLSDKLGMEGSASLGKILYEINAGSFDTEGNYVGRGKGTVQTGRDNIKRTLKLVLQNNPAWAEKLRKAGVNIDADIDQLMGIGTAALSQSGSAVASAGIDPNDPDFARRYQSNLNKFKAAQIPEFVSSGASKMDVSQLAADFESRIAQVDEVGTSAKAVGLEGKFNFDAMISTIRETSNINYEAATLMYAAALKKDMTDSDEAAEVRAGMLAAKGKQP